MFRITLLLLLIGLSVLGEDTSKEEALKKRKENLEKRMKKVTDKEKEEYKKGIKEQKSSINNNFSKSMQLKLKELEDPNLDPKRKKELMNAFKKEIKTHMMKRFKEGNLKNGSIDLGNGMKGEVIIMDDIEIKDDNAPKKDKSALKKAK